MYPFDKVHKVQVLQRSSFTKFICCKVRVLSSFTMSKFRKVNMLQTLRFIKSTLYKVQVLQNASW